ncbi:MAG TPA: hypothetical protein VKT27_08470 [Candidatus Binataceae bacterium]|nr:hypothetical protein [Candidatus Binataceae bacterium]
MRTATALDGSKLLVRKLTERRVWQKLLRERLNEPLHLNLAAAVVAVLGNYRSKVEWDLIVRPHYAYGVLHAADQARAAGLSAVTVIEFGVANGEGLMNLCALARRTEQCTGVRVNVVGFDSGVGMPEPLDYRDHPELYALGDFPMDQAKLKQALPANAELRIGALAQTLVAFNAEEHAPIGFASVDVDYYSSTREALRLFADADASKYVAVPLLYFDDIMFETHNEWSGELLAINEFNAQQANRKIAVDRFLPTRRIFRNARWLRQIYVLHLFDHPWRSSLKRRREVAALENRYL